MTTPMTPAEAMDQWIADNPSMQGFRTLGGAPSKAKTGFDLWRQGGTPEISDYRALGYGPVVTPLSDTSASAASEDANIFNLDDETLPEDGSLLSKDNVSQIAPVPRGVEALVDPQGNPDFGQQYAMTLKMIQDEYPSSYGSNAWYKAAMKQRDFFEGAYILQVLMHTTAEEFNTKNYMSWVEFINQEGEMIDEEKLTEGWNRYAVLSTMSEPEAASLLSSGDKTMSLHVYDKYVLDANSQQRAALAKASYKNHPQYRTFDTNFLLAHYNNQFQLGLGRGDANTPEKLSAYLAWGAPGEDNKGDKYNAMKAWYVDEQARLDTTGSFMKNRQELTGNESAVAGATDVETAITAMEGKGVDTEPTSAPTFDLDKAQQAFEDWQTRVVPSGEERGVVTPHQKRESGGLEFEDFARTDPAQAVQPIPSAVPHDPTIRPAGGYEPIDVIPTGWFGPRFGGGAVDWSGWDQHLKSLPPQSPYETAFDQRFFDPANIQAARDAYRNVTGVTGSGGISGIGRRLNRLARGLTRTEQIPSFPDFQRAFTRNQLANQGIFPSSGFIGGN